MRIKFLIQLFLSGFILLTCSTLMDFESPKVKILSPANGSQAFGVVHVQVEATDNKKIDHIDLILDGSKVMSAQNSFLAYDWDLTKTNEDVNHTIMAKAYDPGGNWGEAKVGFFGFGKAPSSPELSEPADAGISDNAQPVLKWSAVSLAQAYHLQVGDSLFSQLSVDDSTIAENQYTITTPLQDATYFWRVRSRYNEGNWSEWSDAWSFTVSTIPSSPSLKSPSNASTGVSTSPILSWDSISGASSYGLRVSTDSGFAALVEDQSGITATSYQVNGLSEGTTYYWRVNATGPGGTSGWSDDWHFTTVVSPPPVPTLLSPSNGAMGVATGPTLSWNSMSGASSYGLQVSTDSIFTSLVSDQSEIIATSQQVSGLSEGTTYYWRVNATGSGGTSDWSERWDFKTSFAYETGTMIGNDGKIYQTVKIGTQWWMAENLRETKYRNGSAIPNVTTYSTWASLYSGARCAYENKQSNADEYGYLYNWYAVNDSRDIAPQGWHVPTDSEWQTLVDYLGGESGAGGKMKETGTSHWISPNSGATNESGFTALPGGCYSYNNKGTFNYLGYHAYFWSSTQYDIWLAWYRNLNYYHSNVDRNYSSGKSSGISVRLVKD